MNEEHFSGEGEKSSLKYNANYRLIHESILNDKEIKDLQSLKVKITESTIPQLVDGKIVPVNEANHPQLSKLNELIECRIKRIEDFYSRE